jgi:glycosyltransferase involved in cell wall biosynthesis
VHCHDLDTVLPGWVIARIKRAPIVFDAHEHFPSQMRHSSGLLTIRIADWVERFVVPHMDAIVTVGDRLATLMQSEGAKLIAVVHNSRDKEEFAFSSSLVENWKAALGLSEKQLVISFLGRLTASRYIDILLDAVARRPEVGLLLAGRGPMEALARDFAQRHHNIRYAGFISEQLVSLLTCVSDVIYCCFDPTDPINYFSLPNKFFQALAAGRALMATKGVGEFGEMIEEYQCGVLLPTVSSDEIIRAIDELSQPATLARYQQNASRAFVAELRWEASKQNLLALYRQLCANDWQVAMQNGRS